MIISFVVVCIVAGLETIDLYRIFGTYGERFETVINLLIFPATPIIYGWIVKDKIGAIIVGTVPIFILLFFGNLFFGNLIYKDGLNISRFLTILVYAVSLATLGGLAGYFSSKRELKYLIISIFFGIMWTPVFLSGIN
ncbi:hypothetical protein [Methanosarcina acetivorans]|uniref:Uncharacterized protein n=1 Tax=Methanosarcina acetivorans (strain ATCC 35395 / DSM 2834 / JCM 12185 / C2A) TaxID=188937 RepID=Q8TT70_METAC|nr:hypothetical protein [Methanosarcina acetivorans]AAM04011.1 predicted protein [Methanosarcina acetivorans C2A]